MPMFSCCIQKQGDFPATCCCGCTLKCGVITIMILESIGLISSIATMQVFPIVMQTLFVLPMWLLLCYDKSRTLRTINYVW